MSTITGIKCDFCFKIFFAEKADTEIETITIPGVKIGKDTYRLNNGHICKETCLPLLERALGDTKEVPLADEPLPENYVRLYKKEEV
jgi:hypothetical protein